LQSPDSLINHDHSIMQDGDPTAESVEGGGPHRFKRHDNGPNGLPPPPPPYARETTRDGQSVKPSRKPRQAKRGLSRTMTEWKQVCVNKNLPDTSSKPTDYVIVYRYEKADDAETTNDKNGQVDSSVAGAETTNDEDETGGCCCARKTKQQSAFEARQVSFVDLPTYCCQRTDIQ
jgi:hypothetical protein